MFVLVCVDVEQGGGAGTPLVRTSGLGQAGQPGFRGARERFQISYWDAAIIEASRAMGCPQVLSEDLNDGQDYAGVRVVNPFR